jgi:MerR family mercuric resistance operon transcriptional regulator
MPSLATLPLAVVAQRSGVDLETVEEYVRLRLLSRARRTTHGLVLYPHDEPERVIFIRRALELGFGVPAVHDMLGRRGRRRPGCQEIHAIAREHLAAVRRRIADLTLIERTLSPLVGDCPQQGPREVCPIVAGLSNQRAATG